MTRFKVWTAKRAGYGYEPDQTVGSREEAEQRAVELRRTGRYFSIIWTEA